MSTAAEGDGHSSLLQQQQQAGSQHYGMSSMNNVKAGGRKKKTSIHLHVQHEESEASALRPPGSRHWFSINGRNPLSLTPSPSSLKASVSDGFVESPKRHSQYSAKERCNNNTPSSINWSAEMLVFHSSGLLASVELHAPLLVTAGLVSFRHCSSQLQPNQSQLLVLSCTDVYPTADYGRYILTS